MKHRAGLFAVLLLMMLWLGLFPGEIAYGNSAEPPGLTVLVLNAPEDLTVAIAFTESVAAPVELEKQIKAWEVYFRFFYHLAPGPRRDLEGARLLVAGGGKTFEAALPEGTFREYNNLVTLDFAAQSVTPGQSPCRVPLLVAMRVAATLLIEGAVFWLFGYRSRKSWGLFLTVNLITQIGLNAMLTGPEIGGYWPLGLLLLEVIVLVIELIAFSTGLKEQSRARAIGFAILANAASLLAGGFLISRLPI